MLAPVGGLAFWARSVSAGFYPSVSGEDGSYVPAVGGDELLFVSVVADSFAPPFGQTQYHYAAPELSVTFTGQSVSLPETITDEPQGVAGSQYGADGAEYADAWLVAVPKGAGVDLVAAENGFAQTLNLRTGARVGATPTVLYRDASGPLGLDLQPNLSGTLSLTAGGSRVNFPVTLNEAVLSYFDLAEPNAPSGLAANQAWLLVEVSVGTGTSSSGDADWYYDPSTTAEAVTIDAAGQSGIAARQAPPAPDPGNTGTSFEEVFGFVVPAGLSSTTVTVGPGPNPSVYFQGPNDLSPTVELSADVAPATFALTFPPATTDTATSPSPGATTPTTSGVAPPSTLPSVSVRSGAPNGRRHSGGGDGWLLATLASGSGAVIIVFAGVFFSRRTKLVEARPVEADTPVWGPPAPTANVAVPSGVTREDGAPDGPRPPDVAPIVTESATDPPPKPTSPETVVPEVDRVRLRVLVMGPLEIQGAQAAIRRRLVLRALIVLALNLGRPMTSEELRHWLATGEYQEPMAASLRSELSRLRAVLAPEVLPDREPGGGYGFDPTLVEVDWVNFTNRLTAMRSAEKSRAVSTGLEALSLVRGPVLQHQSWFGVDKQVWEINASIEAAAGETAALALELGRPDLAAEAAAAGLRAVPASPKLWASRVQAAQTGSGENLDAIKLRAEAEIGGALPAAG